MPDLKKVTAMVSYIVRLYRRSDSQGRAAGVAIDPETGRQSVFSNAQELWSIVNGDTSPAPVTEAEKKTGGRPLFPE